MAKYRYNAENLKFDFISCAELSPDCRILDLGWGGQQLLNGSAFQGMDICFVSDDIRAVRGSVGKDIAAYHAESPAQVSGGFDTAFYHPEGHAAKGQVFHWVDVVFEKMNLGGHLYFSGQKDRGVLSYIKQIEQVFGQVERVGRNGRMQYFKAVKERIDSGISRTEIEHLIKVEDQPGGLLQFSTRDGVFSRDGIDPGSRLLLDHISVDEDAIVCDVGCGYGLLGITCAGLVPHGRVWMGDVSARAVACAKENIEINRVTNASVGVSDLYELAEDTSFDLILSNPPFHEGNKTAWPLIDQAFDKLKPNGELKIVVMRAGPYAKRMESVYGYVEVCAAEGGYTVLSAQKKI
ncbi:MAG: 16S rRNA (guanine1207-N2)-methyltransferase [Candidatus Latescibacterota bacterium]